MARISRSTSLLAPGEKRREEVFLWDEPLVEAVVEPFLELVFAPEVADFLATDLSPLLLLGVFLAPRPGLCFFEIFFGLRVADLFAAFFAAMTCLHPARLEAETEFLVAHRIVHLRVSPYFPPG
jgi:hypothetical protein